MISEWLEKTENLSSTFHFFERDKDWTSFTCYGKQSHVLAKQFYGSSTVLKKDNSLDSLNLSKMMFRKISNALLDQNFSIQIYKKQNDKNELFEKYKFASPGNRREIESIFGSSEIIESSIAAIRVMSLGTHVLLGVAIANMTSQQLFMLEILEESNLARFHSLFDQIYF